MKNYFDLSTENLTKDQCGPLRKHVPRFAILLQQRGYTTEHARTKLLQLRDFSQWLKKKHIGVRWVNERTIKTYQSCPLDRPRRDGEGATLLLLLKHLRELNLVAPREYEEDSGPVGEVIQDYRGYQLKERSLGQATVAGYVAIIRRFLEGAISGRSADFRAITIGDINEFVLKETTIRGRKACQLSTCALRSLFRFLLMRDRLSVDLAQSVPSVAGWRASELPHYMEPSEVESLLLSCDRSSDVGKRNHAILLLLSRLGLRAGEVARLGLDDIHWRIGEIHVNGKNGRLDRLPLPQDVGQAIAEYVRRRPLNTQTRRVFLHAQAPYSELVDSPPNSISSIVRRALKRAGLNPPHKGAHVLRHSLATRMLGEGVSLFQIGQVLRHASIQSTEIYARVDLSALRKLAQPWPGDLP